MSGGRFNNLFEKNLGEALQTRASMEEMAAALERTAALGWYDGKPQGQDVATVAAELRAILAAGDLLSTRFERLVPVLQAMEWTASGDWESASVGRAAWALKVSGG